MNFDECIKKIIHDFQDSESDCIYYLLRGTVLLYINENYKRWSRIYLKGSVRHKSDYQFDIFLTIDYINESTFEMKVGKVIKKNYFNINSENDKIPVRGEPNNYACISGEIYHLENR